MRESFVVTDDGSEACSLVGARCSARRALRSASRRRRRDRSVIRSLLGLVRAPTDDELTRVAQANSEHWRHKSFEAEPAGPEASPDFLGVPDRWSDALHFTPGTHRFESPNRRQCHARRCRTARCRTLPTALRATVSALLHHSHATVAASHSAVPNPADSTPRDGGCVAPPFSRDRRGDVATEKPQRSGGFVRRGLTSASLLSAGQRDPRDPRDSLGEQERPAPRR